MDGNHGVSPLSLSSTAAPPAPSLSPAEELIPHQNTAYDLNIRDTISGITHYSGDWWFVSGSDIACWQRAQRFE